MTSAGSVGTAASFRAPGTERRIVLTAYASFALVGWATVLIPTLIRDVKVSFGQTDTGIGLAYLVGSLLFAAGAFASGALGLRLGRGTVLGAAATVMACGLVAEAAAPAWPVFLVGAALVGAGSGSIDATVNGVVMDLAAATGRGSALNRLHLFYSVGALVSPIVVGALVSASVDWRLPVALTGALALALTVPLRELTAVPAHSAVATERPADRRAGPGSRWPLLGLGAGIACYVAAELGVSNWLVEFLSSESVGGAPFALGMFWLGHATGRLVASRIVDRFSPAVFASTCALAAALCVASGVVAPTGAGQVALFAAAGFAMGPVYPMIMAVSGSLYPNRATSVSGLLTSAGVVGSVVYPPLMGVVSERAGLGVGMGGAAILVGTSAMAILGAARLARRDDVPEGTREGAGPGLARRS